MKIPALPTSHLSYCSNIHPGESWEEVKASLQQHLPRVKQQVCADAKFGVGLRLSARAAESLLHTPDELQRFKAWLGAEQLYVFTLNGFPFGTFHDAVIKENVYLPDWRSSERLAYSINLANILAQLLPSGESGSISTVPVGFKAHFQDVKAVDAALENLLEFVSYAWQLEQRSGVHIALALEPEPSCYLEDTQGTLEFFRNRVFSEQALNLLQSKNISHAACTLETIQRYLGVCVDTCHAAVMFESPLEMARALRAADISIPKVQLTAALKATLQTENTDSTTLAVKSLQAFAEGSYLHQSCVQDEHGQVHFFLDLPETLEFVSAQQSNNSIAANSLKELRSHFHVPVFVEQLENVSSTQSELREFLRALKTENFSQHYEVETYTFDVLPKQLLKKTVDESISRELGWVLEMLA